MATPCKITGELHCRCGYDRPFLVEGESDLRVTLTKLFTDHGVYTTFVLRGMIDSSKDVQIQTARLLENQKEIGGNLVPLIGQENGVIIGDLLTTHIKLAAAVIKAAISKIEQDVEQAKAQLFQNSDQVATAFSQVTNGALPLAESIQMWRLHNELVIKMATLRLSGKYQEEQVTYDVYFNELMAMTKAIFLSLSNM